MTESGGEMAQNTSERKIIPPESIQRADKSNVILAETRFIDSNTF